MGFQVVPALDLADGRLSRLGIGGVEPIDAFGGDPIAAGERFASDGATWLHVVDLDLATTGEARNLPVVSELAALGLQIQASGGVRTKPEAQAMLEAGASRVVLSSATLNDMDALERLLEDGDGRLAVGLEVDGDRVTSRGRDPVNLALTEALAALSDVSAALFLLTLVSRVGGLGGTDPRIVVDVVHLGRPVLVAGGIATIEQIEHLRSIGAAGVVVGRAAVEGALSVREAIARTSSIEPG